MNRFSPKSVLTLKTVQLSPQIEAWIFIPIYAFLCLLVVALCKPYPANLDCDFSRRRADAIITYSFLSTYLNCCVCLPLITNVIQLLKGSFLLFSDYQTFFSSDHSTSVRSCKNRIWGILLYCNRRIWMMMKNKLVRWFNWPCGPSPCTRRPLDTSPTRSVWEPAGSAWLDEYSVAGCCQTCPPLVFPRQWILWNSSLVGGPWANWNNNTLLLHLATP